MGHFFQIFGTLSFAESHLTSTTALQTHSIKKDKKDNKSTLTLRTITLIMIIVFFILGCGMGMLLLLQRYFVFEPVQRTI